MVIVADGTNRAIRLHRSSTDVTTLIDDDEIDSADVVPGWRMSGRRLFGG
jgi:hypothetical protein